MILSLVFFEPFLIETMSGTKNPRMGDIFYSLENRTPKQQVKRIRLGSIMKRSLKIVDGSDGMEGLIIQGKNPTFKFHCKWCKHGSVGEDQGDIITFYCYMCAVKEITKIPFPFFGDIM